MRFDYDAYHWINKQTAEETPLDETNLNHIENGVFAISQALQILTGKNDTSQIQEISVEWSPIAE